jgi:hypothetical protein
MRRGAFSLVAILVVCLGLSALAGPKGPAADVGLVTLLQGEVTYRSALTGKKGEKAVPFMKVRMGDRFQLQKGAELRLIYYASGQQETWQGPAKFDALQKGSKSLTKARPKVLKVPSHASRELRRVPVLLRQAGGSRAGGVLVRSGAGGQTQDVQSPPLSEEEKAELKAARETYAQMRKQFPPDDITPELFLLKVLDDMDLYAEMKKLIREARKIQPDSPALKKFEEWVEKQEKN